MAQTSVNPFGQPQAIAGQGVQNGEEQDQTVMNAEASANMRFGIGVKPGTLDREVLLVTANNSVVEGVTLFDFDHSPGTFGDIDPTPVTGGLKPQKLLQVREWGKIWVQVDPSVVTIVPNVDRGFCRASANAGDTVIGAWRNTDDGHVIDATKQALFTSGVRIAADGSKIAELFCNFIAKP